MKNTALNQPVTDTFKRCFGIFCGAFALDITSYDVDANIGLAQSPRTGYTVAFAIRGGAKPVACRQYRPEYVLDVFEIDTIANSEGVILGAIGAKRADRWKAPIFTN